MTKKYYELNAEEFINSTINADMSATYELFEKYIKPNSTILDLGFGSGRDSLYFSNKGYIVVSTDFCEAFIEHGKKILNNEVLLLDTLKMDFVDKFDGIWACSSLLHFNDEELEIALKNCYNALKKEGIMYTSFKKGKFSDVRNGRFFKDMELDELITLMGKHGFQVLETSETKDVRPGREEIWLGVIIKKQN